MVQITLLNESYFEQLTIKKKEIIGYLVIEPQDLRVHYEETKKSKKIKYPKNYLPKDWAKNGKNTGKKGKREGF